MFMVDIQIAKVSGLCAGCKFAIDATIKELNNGNKVTIFTEIVHNKNVNKYLYLAGATCEDDINKLPIDNTIIIRAHGEPPATYDILDQRGIKYIDCTCINVAKIHKLVKEHYSAGYKIILLSKYKKAMHPEVLGTLGWANNDAILIETSEDIEQLSQYKNEKFYLACQTTFNLAKAETLIKEITTLLEKNSCELIVNNSLCGAQRAINKSSAELAQDRDVMIVVGGANSSNSLELYNNVNSICPSIFIEDISTYKDKLNENGIELTKNLKIGITAGASTRKEELIELKELIEKDLTQE